MEITIAKNSGLCYGVQRALKIAKSTRRTRKGAVFTLGELIHNPRIIVDLKRIGLEAVENPEDIPGGTVVIRSHGISPEVHKVLQKKRLKTVDATCPIVKKIQDLVASLSRKNREIIIVGNKDHPEIKGLIGYSRGRAAIIENEIQARALPRRKRRAVLAQSTQDLYLFGSVVAALIEKTETLEVYNTICRFAQKRQKFTSALASRVDTLFIVGGKSSSNTSKLYQISKRILPHTYFIEKAADITPRMLKGAKRIGLSGGASTPPEDIREAVLKIRDSLAPKSQRENFVQCQN